MSEAEFETIVPQGTNITLQAYDTSETDKVIVDKDAQIAEPKADKYLSENDWNDVSNTKIPLNKEIFALLVDRQSQEKLRPAVIVAKMMPAKSLTWTESKEGDVLCYDDPAGNFHSCNGAQIKYWKHVNVPSKQAETSCVRKQMKLAFTIHWYGGYSADVPTTHETYIVDIPADILPTEVRGQLAGNNHDAEMSISIVKEGHK